MRSFVLNDGGSYALWYFLMAFIGFSMRSLSHVGVNLPINYARWLNGLIRAPAPIENKILFSVLIDQVCVIGEGLPPLIAICALSMNASSIPPAELQRELGVLVNGINKQLEKHQRTSNLVVVKDGLLRTVSLRPPSKSSTQWSTRITEALPALVDSRSGFVPKATDPEPPVCLAIQ
jgi:hypothetical protein